MSRVPDIRQERKEGVERGQASCSCQHGRDQGRDMGHPAGCISGAIGESGLWRRRLAFQYRNLFT